MMRESISKLTSRLYGFLSGFEENGILPGIMRWLKLTFAGAALALIAACAKKQPFDDGFVTCYEPVAVYPMVSEIMVKPNPTKGADSVIVSAKARLENAGDLDVIAAAQCIVEGDTVQMRAKDGAFDEASEELIGRINVKNIKADSAQIYVKVDSKSSGWGIGSTVLRITDK